MSWQRALTGFVAELESRLGRENLVRVSLFGSRARGDHRFRSDLDLLVVVQLLNAQVRDQVHAAALEWELTYNQDLSVKLLSHAEFERLRRGPERFWKNFERDERTLWPMIYMSA